jgi:tetratricopeptide (TPR) repeat protein
MGRYEVRQKLADYVCVTASAGYIPLDQRSRAAKQAAALLERSISEDPADVRHTMYLSTLVKSTFAVMKQTDPGLAVSLAEKSLSFLQKAETLSPNRPRLFLDRAQLLLLLGRNNEAIPALQKAIALDPSNRELRVELVAAHIAAGRNRDAEIEWRGVKAWGVPPTEAEYRKVAVLYAAKKQIVPLIALYKEQLQTYPDNAIILTSLATAYREVGDMESARQTALKAAALSPQIAATLDAFLKTLQKKAATE